MFLALSGLVTLGVSCSSDDNSSDEVKEGQLAVTPDKTEIKEGGSVKFTITLDGKADTSAELFIEDTQIYTPHKFDKAGKYNVVAKKKGAKTSAPVTITVNEKDGGTDPVEKTLTLKADNISVKVGGTVTFTVTDGTAAVADPVIKIVGGEAIKGASWTATKAGEFKFVASKEGFKDSKEVLVIVEEPATEPTGNFIQVGNTVTKELQIVNIAVNAYKNSKGKWVIYEYVDEPGGVPYSVFTVDLGEINEAKDKYLVRSQLIVVVDQTDEENYLFPGQGETFFIKAVAYDFTDSSNPVVVDFDVKEIQKLKWEYPANEPIKFDYLISNDKGKVQFNGNIGNMMVSEVGEDGKAIKSSNSVKTNNITAKDVLGQVAKFRK